MVLIQINKEDQERVFGILLKNGKFRSLGDDKFEIIEHADEVLKKLEEKNISFKRP